MHSRAGRCFIKKALTTIYTITPSSLLVSLLACSQLRSLFAQSAYYPATRLTKLVLCLWFRGLLSQIVKWPGSRRVV